MSVIRLALREIQHRKLNFISATVAMLVAVSLAVAVVTMSDASHRETVRLMRNMGFNLLIIPEGANFADFWSDSFAQANMPEEYVHRLSKAHNLDVQHLVARLQKKVEWRGRKVLLTGMLPEIQMQNMPVKSAMSPEIKRGTVYLGYELWHGQDLSVGDTIEVLGREFTIAKLAAESGSNDDIRIWGHLHDVQEALGLPGQINEIEALHCLCGDNALATIRAGLSADLPGTKVTEMQTIAVMRAETRRMMDRYAAFIIPVVALVCGLWIGLQTLGNVRERRVEIGIYRALGIGSGPIAALFLAKAIIVGLVGALIGFGLGTWLALHFGPGIFAYTAGKITPELPLLWRALIFAPVIAVIASYLPALQAVAQDPAEVLREE